MRDRTQSRADAKLHETQGFGYCWVNTLIPISSVFSKAIAISKHLADHTLLNHVSRLLIG
jgi:hypothetical protein